MKSTLELLAEIGKPVDEYQRKLVEHAGSAVLGDAGAGSGKSTTTIAKAVYMQRELQVPPHRIAFLTFSREATKEVESRYNEICQAIGERKGVKFATLHSFANAVVRSVYKGVRVETDTALNRHFMQIMKTVCQRHDEKYTDNARKALKELLSFSVNQMTKIEDLPQTDKFVQSGLKFEVVRDVWNEYSAYKRSSQVIDFDDMQLIAYNTLKNHESVREAFQKLYDYYIIDEFQDTAPIQLETLRLLITDPNKVTCIGDGDQAIYAFRGASDHFINNFTDYFPGAERLILPTNYRCPENILAPARRMIEKNPDRRHKPLIAAKEGGKSTYVPTKTQLASSKYIADQVIAKFRAGVKPTEIAVIYRNNNQPMFVIDMLLQAGVPVRVSSKESMVYNHFITGDMLDIIAFSFNPMDIRMFEKCAMKIIRGLNKKAIGDVARDMKATGRHWADIIADNTQGRIDASATERMLTDIAHIIRGGGKVKDAIELIQTGYMIYAKWMISGVWDITEEEALDIFDYLKSLGNRSYDELQRYMARAKALLNSFDEEKNAVTITTMHQCKGLQFDYVYILHLGEEIVPNTGILTRLEKELGPAAVAKHIKEERNLTYVAWTRGKVETTATYPESSPSRFILDSLEDGKTLSDVAEDVQVFNVYEVFGDAANPSATTA